ncbi:phosphopantetheine-binding protein [Streptomyces sp. NPDC006552]|uniref:phosphopantetheine-binding protein n=1 Tax=Streptomyces sp. NPDC006552 TaxID=3157179 RepID=UPI0033B46A95
MGLPQAERTDDEVYASVRDLVTRQLPPDTGPLTPTLPLHEAGLTSLGTIATMVAIETEFGVTFPEELITPDTFHNLTTLTRAVASMPAARKAAADAAPGTPAGTDDAAV